MTCVRRGLPICTALLNYITQELFVACSAGVYQMSLPPHHDIASWQTIDALPAFRGGAGSVIDVTSWLAIG